MLGSRHAFNGLADTHGDHLSLAGLPRVIDIDSAARTVTIDGAIRYGDLGPVLERSGFALHNLASLPHISVAGACATATHGSGDRLGNLSTAVVAMELVRADGELVSMSREADGDAFAGSVVSLGALGVVTRLTLAVEPSYRVRQDVYEGLPIAALRDHFDALTASGDSVSLFPRWRGAVIDQVWRKRRVEEGDDGGAALNLFGARRATTALHPLGDLPPDACTEQLGVPGPWLDRLPHFRLDHTPSHGDELQSEFFVGREHAVEAFEALDALRDRLAPLVFVSEIRTIAADDLWLSPAYGRDLGGVPLHLAPGLAGGPCPAARRRGRARAVRAPSALGEAVHDGPGGRARRATRGWASSRPWPAAPTRTASSATTSSRRYVLDLRRPRRSTANMARSRRAPGRVISDPEFRTPHPTITVRRDLAWESPRAAPPCIDKFLTPRRPVITARHGA